MSIKKYFAQAVLHLRQYGKEPVFRNTAIVGLGMGIASALNFFYYVLVARMLSPEEYAHFNTVASIVLMYSFIFSPCVLAFVRMFTECFAGDGRDGIKQCFDSVFKKVSIVVVVLAIGGLTCSQLIASFLHIESIMIYMCVLICVGTFLATPCNALIQGLQKFTIYSAMWVVGISCKVFGGWVFMLIERSAVSALWGLVVVPFVLLIAGFLVYWKTFSILKYTHNEGDRPKHISGYTRVRQYLIPAICAMFSFAVLTNGDMLLVKHFFPVVDAGYYSFAQVIGKILLFTSFVVVVAIFPQAVANNTDAKKSRALLYKGLAIGALLIGIGILTIILMPRIILNLLVGAVYDESLVLISRFSFAMGFYGLVWILIGYGLTLRSYPFIKKLFLLSFLEVFVIYSYHPSLSSVVNTVLIFAVVTFFVTFYDVRKTCVQNN